MQGREVVVYEEPTHEVFASLCGHFMGGSGPPALKQGSIDNNIFVRD
jgi:hypothetical protein